MTKSWSPGGPMPLPDYNELIASTKDHSWLSHNPYTDRNDPQQLSIAVRGEGCYIFDHEGKQYLDATGSSHCSAVGHGRQEIADAVSKQIHALEFSGSGLVPFINAPSAKLSQKLADLCPGSLNRVFYTLSGSEAVEAALKIARQYHAQTGNPKKYKVLYRNYAHHGYTWGAMSVSGDPAIRSIIFEPTVPMGVMVPEANPFRCLHCSKTCNLGCARSIEETIKYEDPDSIAAIIVEPISKMAVVPPPEYWEMVVSLCKKNNILLIADEVVTAFGRTGKWFAVNHWNIIPDLMVLGKTLGAGYMPIGAVVGTEEIYKVFLGSPDKTLIQSHTLGNHPVVNAAALANLEIIENEGLVGRSASLGPYFKSQLEKLNKHQITGDIRSIGLLAQIDLIKDQNTKEPFGGSNEGRQLTRFMVDNGLYMRCSGHSLNIHPSLIITKDQIDFMVDVFDKTLTYAEQELLTK